MNIWNKVLLVLITLTGILFTVFASNRYVLQKDWAGKIAKLEEKLSRVEKEVVELNREIHGDPLQTSTTWGDLPLIAQKDQLRSLIDGTVWVGCQSQAMAENKDGVTATFVLPARYNYAGVQANNLVFVFDSGRPFVPAAPEGDAAGQEPGAEAKPAETPVTAESEPGAESTESGEPAQVEVVATEPAQFLGIFKVVKVNRTEISLTSVSKMDQNEIAVLDQSVKGKNSWIVYPDRLPVDAPTELSQMLDDNTSFAALLTPEENQFFHRGIYTADEIMILAGDPAGVQNENRRMPIDFNVLLEAGYTNRDNLNATISRKEMSLSDMNTVLIEQLLTLGTGIPETAKALVDENAYNTAKGEFKGISLTEQKSKLTDAVAAMQHQRALVRDKLELVETALTDMRAQIAQLLERNRELALAIADAQFKAVKKIMEMAARSESTTDTGVAHSGSALAGI